ncbi:MAG TPA: response regulator [Myxococcaceae bacterium]|nr:response regulator [Myxococcaceae bacterium]
MSIPTITAAVPAATPTGPCVLVLDDDRVSRMALSRPLQKNGYQVVEAARISEAHALLAAHDVKVLIVDGLLPDGTGLEFITDLRKQGNNAPVFFVSSFFKDLQSYGVLRRELRVAGVLPKPFSAEQLTASVGNALAAEAAAHGTGSVEAPRVRRAAS